MATETRQDSQATTPLLDIEPMHATMESRAIEPAPVDTITAFLLAEPAASVITAETPIVAQSGLSSEMRHLAALAHDLLAEFRDCVSKSEAERDAIVQRADAEVSARDAIAAGLESEIQASVHQVGVDRRVLSGTGSMPKGASDSASESDVRKALGALRPKVEATLAAQNAFSTADGTGTYILGSLLWVPLVTGIFLAFLGGWSGFFTGLFIIGPLLAIAIGLGLKSQSDRELSSSLDHAQTDLQTGFNWAASSLRQYRVATGTSHARQVGEANDAHAIRRADAERWYQAQSEDFRQQVAEYCRRVDGLLARWQDINWQSWSPPVGLKPGVRLGTMTAFSGVQEMKLQRVAFPVVQDVPYGLSMVWRHRGAEQAHVPEDVLLQILMAIPAGKARFTLLDPVGLGRNVASLMHLAEHDPNLISDRAWVEPRHIEQQLADLSEQMQTIIQKYLKREFETMEEYNQQAGNIEEPYRLLVVNNFPANFTTDALRHLVNIATIGPRCGVYTMIAIDDAQKLPHGFVIDDLLNAASMVLAGVPVAIDGSTEMAWSIREPKLHSLMVTPDPGPSGDLSRQVLDRVGKEAVKNSVVQVPFADLVPDEPSRWWAEESVDRLRAPIVIFGARKLQMLTLGANEKGDDLFNGVLMVGKPGSGKSNLNHVAIMSLATAYSPEELELYLLDFKQGVEFAVYVKSQLPHARVIAVESEREFALSVLKRLDQELEDRGKLFREVTAQVDDTASIATYRHRTGKKLPRIVLLIDEYQELFTEDDALAQTASVVLERLVRLGRAYGIHLVLSTQTLAGNANLNKRTTQGLMTVRIALMSSDADARLILAEDNPEARLLNRPGEAIYNDQAGRLEGNNRFQAAHMPPDERNTFLTALAERAAAEYPGRPAPIVFEGNRAADVDKNRELGQLLRGNDKLPPGPKAWLGDPVAIAEPTGPVISQQAGSNLLIVGQELDLAYGMLGTSLAGLARYHELKQDEARFEIVDMGPVDTIHSETMKRIAGAFSGNLEQISRRRLTDRIESLHQELERRLALEDVDRFPPRYLVIAGLHRARDLRGEDGFSFGSALDESPQLSPRQMFAKVLREGPDVGIHVLAWVDTVGNLLRVIDQRVLSEFDHRVVMQMSADDSFKLIDAKSAVGLGANRAILHSEERGTIEKFRPYGLPSAEWLAGLEARPRVGRP